MSFDWKKIVKRQFGKEYRCGGYYKERAVRKLYFRKNSINVNGSGLS